MNCPSCGTEIGNSKFCPNCGANVNVVPSESSITCPKCGGHNVNVQIMQDKAKTKGHGHKRGLLWKCGRLMLIICTCGLWLLVGRSKGTNKSKTKFVNNSVAVCQSCGYSWKMQKIK